MSEHIEELTDDQAAQAITQLVVQFRAMSKLDGVLKRYQSVKQSVPELEGQKAALEKQLATLKETVVKVGEEQDREAAKIINDLAAKVQAAQADHDQREQRLQNSLKVMDIREKERQAGLDRARAEASQTMEAIKNTVKEEREKAGKEIAQIRKSVEIEQRRHDELLGQFEALKQKIRTA